AGYQRRGGTHLLVIEDRLPDPMDHERGDPYRGKDRPQVEILLRIDPREGVAGPAAVPLPRCEALDDARVVRPLRPEIHEPLAGELDRSPPGFDVPPVLRQSLGRDPPRVVGRPRGARAWLVQDQPEGPAREASREDRGRCDLLEAEQDRAIRAGRV